MWRRITITIVVIMMGSICNSGRASEEATASAVTSMSEDILLKETRIKPGRIEVSEEGWVAANLEAKRGETVQVAAAVCSSPAVAGAIYDRRMQLLSVPPLSPLGGIVDFKVGDRCTIGKSWAFFVRDNVYISVGWKDGFNAQMLERIDKLISTESTLVKRGQFADVPEPKDIQREVVIAPGDTKEVRLDWVGLGEKQPRLHITSPDYMSNLITGKTARLKVIPGSSEVKYPVKVCAIGEGLVFATATIHVIVQPGYH